MRTATVLAMAIGLGGGCAGEITEPVGQCATELAPAAPVVTLRSPARVIATANLALDVSAFAPPAAELATFARLEVEIWRANPDGSARDRAWYGAVTDPARRTVSLADGTFENAAALVGDLEPWQDHVIRARDVIDTGDGCLIEGAWSDKRDFLTDDGSEAIFDATVVRDFRITLPPESYAAIDAEALPPGCVPYERNYYGGTLTYDGRAFPDVGVKVKGGCGSARNLGQKAGLKLHLGWDSPLIAGCPEKRRILGLERFTFNNMVQDRSMAHELMAYRMYRAMGVPVPRAVYARVHVNDVFYGIYLNVETVDRRFLARHFDHNGGQLYEGTYNCDIVGGSVRDDDTGCMRRTFEPDVCDGAPDAGDDPLDYSTMHQLIAEIDAMPADGFYAAMSTRFDMDEVMSMWAVDAVLSHWDGHIYAVVNNYRVYHDPSTDRWSIIPSGLDQTFQNIGDDPWNVVARIGRRCLQEPACEAAFAARLRQATETFIALDLGAQRAALRTQVEALVAEPVGPGREWNPGGFDGEHAETQAFIDQRAAQVMQQITTRGF
jgi:hypothetical protein